jgi:hypothetical protein
MPAPALDEGERAPDEDQRGATKRAPVAGDGTRKAGVQRRRSATRPLDFATPL